MDSHKALKRCIGPHAPEVAKRFVKSIWAIYKWMEDNSVRNPLDVLAEIIDIARDGGQEDAALAPIHWLEDRYGIIGFKLPEPGHGQPLVDELVSTVKEFGDLIAAVGDSLSQAGDSGSAITLTERRRILEEGEHALRAMTTLLHLVKEATR